MSQTDTFICPATKLPIRHRPEWHWVSLGENYRISIDLLGEQIILTHSSGVPSPASAHAALDLMNEIINQYLPDRPYIQIFDYNDININHSMEARRIVIERLKERKHMVGAVYYGLNPMIRVSVQIARLLRQLPFPMLIADSYPKAVNLALDLLDEHKREPLIREAGDQIDRQTTTLLQQISTPDHLEKPDNQAIGPVAQQALTILADEHQHIGFDNARARNREILQRLEEIIRCRNERARSYQRSKSNQPD